MTNFTTRFAPSPTGLLHLGHAYSALIVQRAARQAGGRYLLRLEDIDQTRCKPKFEDAIYEDLSWLGIKWELPVRRQSDHFDDYEKTLDRLRQRALVYRCFKTRKEVAEEISRAPHTPPSGPEGVPYIGEALDVEEENDRVKRGDRFAWRLSLSAAKTYLGETYDDLHFTNVTDDGEMLTKATPKIFGDAIIARKDAGTSYHLASVHDDALQGVTHIIRGMDLYACAHLHCLLQKLLNYPLPTYKHHKLITDDDGKRLAKRDQSITLQALRQGGATRQNILSRLGLE